MCFFLAEGFRHTHDKKKYYFRLLLFAVISQPVYYIYVYGTAPTSILHFMRNMSMMVSLMLAFICLLILTNDKLNITAKGILTVITISFAQFADWGYIIPVWTIIFFFFNKGKYMMLAAFIAATIIILPVTFLKYYDSFAAFSFNYGALFALIPLQLYNGKRERSSTPLKKKINCWFFYIYYPLHMMVIILIAIESQKRYYSLTFRYICDILYELLFII
ncbi:MAG: conjugal transfer protein TraX [Ruminococcus sp.]|uniref:TraX family protein n=1 Tax=Ruminococcus sp. TaxID=41978 RepID=UPI002A03B5B2|nr:conjugal transfer protein TraX [Ruminococcus sp.]